MQDANVVQASPGGSAQGPHRTPSESPNVSPHQAYPPQFSNQHTMSHAPHPHQLPYSHSTYAYQPMSGVHQLPPPVGTTAAASSGHVPTSLSSSYNTAGPSHTAQQQQQHILPHPVVVAEAGPSNSHIATSPSFSSTSSSTRRSSGGGKTFTCTGYQGCSMSFSRSEHLARHVRKHTGEPFPVFISSTDSLPSNSAIIC